MRQSIVVMVTAFLFGCTPAVPYRTALSPLPGSILPQKCAPFVAQPTNARGGALNREDTGDGHLYFVELDDQGLLYPEADPRFGGGSCHVDALMADLTLLAKTERLSILVYVHGWKHNASAGDNDVNDFKNLLRDAALVEQAKEAKFGHPRHRVVGVYVSWRGKSIDLPEPFVSTSFWDRKQTAQHVAIGESRTLFARLRAFQAVQNAPAAGATDGKADVGEKKVLMILMGHSFGGLILYSAVAQSLVTSVHEAAMSPDEKPVVPRFADMVIVANPAIEALRYTPLHRAAFSTAFRQYQSPIFVSVTSTADWANGKAFPAGRYLSTVLQKHASDEERKANRNTIGNVDDYITHELKPGGGACQGWELFKPTDADAREKALRNLARELENAAAFVGADSDSLSLKSGWHRQFCGDTTLTHVRGHPNSPIWNIRTTKEIVQSHNEIHDPRFVNFVRQLYHDVVLSRAIADLAKTKREARR